MTDPARYAGYTLDALLALANAANEKLKHHCESGDDYAPCEECGMEIDREQKLLDAAREAVPALIERIQYLVAERAQYREKLAKLLGIDPEKDSVLEAVRDLATGRDDFARRCLDWDRETYNVVTIDEVLAAVKDELAREKERP